MTSFSPEMPFFLPLYQRIQVCVQVNSQVCNVNWYRGRVRYPGVSFSCNVAHSLHLTGFKSALLRTTATQRSATDSIVSTRICATYQCQQHFRSLRPRVFPGTTKDLEISHMIETRKLNIQNEVIECFLAVLGRYERQHSSFLCWCQDSERLGAKLICIYFFSVNFVKCTDA